MKTKCEPFEVLVPDLDGTGVAERVMVTIPLEWDEELNQWLLAPEAHRIIEDTKARHMGLLLPAQFKELRERYDYTQKEMGELFQVGEKSWTRWESGKHRPSRSISLLIRALYEGEVSINYLLKRAGKPAREESEPVVQTFQFVCKAWKSAAPDGDNNLAQYFETSAKPIQIQVESGQGKSALIAHLLKAVHENPGATEHLLAEEVATSRQRYGVPTPSHIYPQPRLTTFPTVA